VAFDVIGSCRKSSTDWTAAESISASARNFRYAGTEATTSRKKPTTSSGRGLTATGMR